MDRQLQSSPAFRQRVRANLSPGLRRVATLLHLDFVKRSGAGGEIADRLLKEKERLAAYPWSSFGYHLSAPAHRPAWIRSDRPLGEHGIEVDTTPGREEFERRMEARRLDEADEETAKAFRRGWYLVSEGFRKAMIEKMEGKLKGHHVAEVRRESA